MPLELSGHAQMHSPAPTGLSGVGMQQLSDQIFAASSPVANRLTSKPPAKGCRTPGAGHSSLAEDFGLLDDKRLKTARQSPTNRLDFRKFRQETQAGSSSSSAKLLVLMPPSEPCRPL